MGKKTVLIVDGGGLARMNAVFMFEEIGFEVLKAGDGIEALAIFEARPDILRLFSDCRMPNMS